MSRDSEILFVLDPEACTHCNDCLSSCPREAIELTEDDIYIDPDACDGCEDCVLVCPTTAIQLAESEVVLRPRRRREGEVLPLDRGRRVRREGAPWRLSDVAVGLALLLVMTLGQRALQLPMLLRGLSPDTTHILLTAWMIFFYVAVVAALFFVSGRRGAVLEDLGVRSFKLKRAAVNSLVALVVIYAITIVYALVTNSVGFQNNTRIATQMLRWFGFGPLGFFLSVLVAVVIAPIAEEAFFRGFVYTALRERIGIGGAMVLSGLIFALYHGNLWLIIPVMFLGVALAWLFETQDSLGPPLLFHGLYNFLAIIQIYFLSGR